MENSMSSVRQSQPQPYLRTISVAMHMPVPPRAVDKPMLYLARCHMWLMSQKAMEKVPAIHESVGFLESI